MKAAINLVAREFRANTGHRIYVNDLALPWGGLLDVNNNWSGPHREHAYGWSADVRTHTLIFPGYPNCLSNPSLYSREELAGLMWLLEKRFKVITHPSNSLDSTCPHFHCKLK